MKQNSKILEITIRNKCYKDRIKGTGNYKLAYKDKTGEYVYDCFSNNYYDEGEILHYKIK